MKTYVFIFVPVYVEKQSGAPIRPDVRTALKKTRRIFFHQDRHLQPYWTCFIENPRPPSLDRQ
jgi:hypothetical protein